MIDVIDGVLEPSLWFLADWSLRWALLVGVLAVWLAIVRPRRSATRYLLCLLVLVAGLLLPAMPRWGSGFTTGKPHPTVITGDGPADNPQLPASKAHTSDRVSQREPSDLAGTGFAHDPSADSGSPLEFKPAGQPLGFRRIAVICLAALWTVVVGLLFARRIGGWILLERTRRTAAPVEGIPLQLFQDCRTQLGVRRPVTLATHPMVHSPLTLGLHRPRILVPPTWPELSVQVQRGSLLHELAHLARYDDWTALGLEFVRVVFFFHPLLHWLIGRIEYERELLCDEAAVVHGIDPRDYAGVLLEFSRQVGKLRPTLMGSSYPLGFGHRRTVKARIHRLLEGNMNHWMSPLPSGRAIALATVALALGLALGSLRVRALETEIEHGSAQRTTGDAVPLAGGEVAKAATPALRQEVGQSVDAVYHIKPFHVLKIDQLTGDDSRTFTGNYLVEPDGKVDIGSRYGKVMVSGLTLEDAEDVVRNLLKRSGVSQPKVSVSLAGWVSKWLDDPGMKAPYHIKPLHLLHVSALGAPLTGDFLIEPSGKINLGPNYGRVAVGGLTLEEAQQAIEKHLKKLGWAVSGASVTLAGWKSDWHDLRKQGTWPSNGAPPKPGSSTGTLSYGNKTFAEWRGMLVSDLKPEVRIEAIKALSAFGANGYGKEAAEAIIEVMRGYDPAGGDDRPVIDAAYSAFRKIGPEGVPVLLDELKHGKRNGRRFAIIALAFTDAASSKAVAPAILEAIKDEDSFVRHQAVMNVKTGSIDPKRQVTALTEALTDEDPNIRNAAVGRLSQMGQDAKSALPALIGALKDQKAGIRRSVVWALKTTGAKVQDVMPGLIQALKDEDQMVREAATEYVQTLGPEAKDAVPILIANFAAHPEERYSIAIALGSIGPAAKDALPILVEFLQQAQTQGSNVQRGVQEALRKISK